MSFIDEHPNYKTYHSEKFYVKDFPSDIEEALQGLLIKLAVGESRKLKYLINKIATIVNSGITQNYNWDYLLNDITHCVKKIINSEYNKFFDLLEILYDEDIISSSEINEFLDNNSIGYEFSNNLLWTLKDDSEIKIIKRTENIVCSAKDMCQQAREHLKQIINNINTGTDRAMKDALRDALSALETLMKEITKTNDIKDASKNLRALNLAPDIFIKEGLSMWDRIHDLYPDIRHGNPTIQTIDKSTLFYCLNKILIYIEFLCDLEIK